MGYQISQKTYSTQTVGVIMSCVHNSNPTSPPITIVDTSICVQILPKSLQGEPEMQRIVIFIREHLQLSTLITAIAVYERDPAQKSAIISEQALPSQFNLP